MNLQETMTAIGNRARATTHVLSLSSVKTRNAALYAAARNLRAQAQTIQQENAKDMQAGKERGLSAALMDRLFLTPERIADMATGLETIAEGPDPLGEVMAAWTRPNGLNIERVRTPLGVIGVIYESRPNVTADAGGLCLKAGNATILRGGSDSFHSAGAILDCLQEGLEEAGLPRDAILRVPTIDRAAVGIMLRMDAHIDVLVPRGGKSLVERIMAESRIPLFKHLQGLCHTYIHKDASPAMATAVVVNAKMRRTGICGATETLLVDRDALTLLPAIMDALSEAGCAVVGDDDARGVDARIGAATEEDWQTEYLDAKLSVRVVDNMEQAIAHIDRYSSAHTDAILTENPEAATEFLNRVDSAIVMHNASTQFADGGEFGMGAEIGIATGRLHARGPIGAMQLTSFKYRVHGKGQCRPLHANTSLADISPGDA